MGIFIISLLKRMSYLGPYSYLGVPN